MAELFASRRRDEWAASFAGVDCCVTPVLSPEEALANEQLADRAMVFEADGLRQFAPPLQISDHPFAVNRPAPGVGQHSDEILLAAGYSPERIAALRATGVFGRGVTPAA